VLPATSAGSPAASIAPGAITPRDGTPPVSAAASPSWAGEPHD